MNKKKHKPLSFSSFFVKELEKLVFQVFFGIQLKLAHFLAVLPNQHFHYLLLCNLLFLHFIILLLNLLFVCLKHFFTYLFFCFNFCSADTFTDVFPVFFSCIHHFLHLHCTLGHFLPIFLHEYTVFRNKIAELAAFSCD